MPDWIPTREKDLRDLARQWDTLLKDPAKQTAYGWDAAECSEVSAAIGGFEAAVSEYLANKTHGKRVTKDEKKKAMIAAMRDFADASVRYNKKMTAEEKLVMGVVPESHGHNPRPKPTELVEFEISTVPSDHRIIARFRISGSIRWGKGPYHAAEIRFWVRSLTGPAPLDANEEGWHSVADTASPWEKVFPGADAGKRLYIVMRWENNATGEDDDAGKGPWSIMQNVLIP